MINEQTPQPAPNGIWPKLTSKWDQWHPPLTPPPGLVLGTFDQYRAPLIPPAECFTETK